MTPFSSPSPLTNHPLHEVEARRGVSLRDIKAQALRDAGDAFLAQTLAWAEASADDLHQAKFFRDWLYARSHEVSQP